MEAFTSDLAATVNAPRPTDYRSYNSHRPGPKENRKLRSVHVRRATDAKTASAYVRLSTDITVSVQVSIKTEARIDSVQIQIKTEAIVSVQVSQNKKLCQQQETETTVKNKTKQKTICPGQNENRCVHVSMKTEAMAVSSSKGKQAIVGPRENRNYNNVQVQIKTEATSVLVGMKTELLKPVSRSEGPRKLRSVSTSG